MDEILQDAFAGWRDPHLGGLLKQVVETRDADLMKTVYDGFQANKHRPDIKAVMAALMTHAVRVARESALIDRMSNYFRTLPDGDTADKALYIINYGDRDDVSELFAAFSRAMSLPESDAAIRGFVEAKEDAVRRNHEMVV
jgi:hypothetical protein